MGILCLTGGIIRTIVSIIIVTRSIVPRSVVTKSSSIKLYKEDKGLLFNSDPWPPAEQKLEMPCDTHLLIETPYLSTITSIVFLTSRSLCFPGEIT